MYPVMDTRQAKRGIKVEHEPETKPKSSVKQKKQTKTASKPASKEKKSKAKAKANTSVKCRRGFKVCRNEVCQQLVHIHKRICPHCNHEFDFLPKENQGIDDIIAKAQRKTKKKRTQANSDDENDQNEPVELDITAKKKLFYRVPLTYNYDLA